MTDDLGGSSLNAPVLSSDIHPNLRFFSNVLGFAKLNPTYDTSALKTSFAMTDDLGGSPPSALAKGSFR